MRARPLINAMRAGHVATDYIRFVHDKRNSPPLEMPPTTLTAPDLLESFGKASDLPDDPGPPVTGVVIVLTEGLPEVYGPQDGRIDGATLFKGCRVRLVGIPERRFVVTDIFWDEGEARITKIDGERAEYVLPWDCLRFDMERQP